MALSERSGGVLDTPGDVELRVSVGRRTPLAELLELFKAVLSDERKLCVEHRCHMSRIEEETVTSSPIRVLRIILEELGIEDVDEVSATHRSARMSGLCLFHH